MSRETKIDWADSTWNPVTGCRHNCEYCYARKIARRFGGVYYEDELPNRWGEYECERLHADGDLHELDYPLKNYGNNKIAPYPFEFDPTFYRYKLEEPKRWKKPRTIFVCSMADLFGEWVPDEWIAEVFMACEAAPQHRYLFLTKNPKRYMELQRKGKLPKQHWYGTSVTRKDDRDFFAPGYNTFVSIEPILESFSDEKHAAYRQMVQPWAILGAETGNRKNKIVPKKEWITELVDYYSKFGYTKFFMKESLRELMGNDFRQETPWEDEDER